MERMECDLLIVGAGPSGLSAAIRAAQLAEAAGVEQSIMVIEKGSEVGAHILSGNCLETRALDELLPDWKERGAPLNTAAKDDYFYLLSKKSARRLPTPPQMKNHGNYIISLANLCRWLAEQAEAMGVQIFPGFPAREVLYNDEGAVIGIRTGEFGRGKKGEEKDGFQPAMELVARYTLFAEGCRGSLTRTLEERFDLREDADPQTYAIGLKELWEIPAEQHSPGKIEHTIGWPMQSDTYGGAFLYHLENNQVALGLVIGLDYSNPHLNPFKELQRYKHHPHIAATLEGGKRIAYGARALNEGGWQSVPKLHFPGGVLMGCGAGFMNVPKIKGTHTAMKSGMLAAEAAMKAIAEGKQHTDLEQYGTLVQKSWIMKELKKVRNIRPAFHKFGLWGGLVYSALDTYLLRGHAPWTFRHAPDHEALKPASESAAINYPEPDGVLSYDLLSSVYISNTNHEEDQPVHLTLSDTQTPITINLERYDSPESRYCPAGVYEIVGRDTDTPQLQINAQNCLHCKTCDIKDPTQNIRWVTPEGGGGPNYGGM